jgi:exportin-T
MCFTRSFGSFLQGDEFVNYLHAEYLPTLQISPQLIDEYCQALRAENKVFKNYVKVSRRNVFN